MGMIRLKSPLVFPGGRAGFDPLHPASRDVRVSVVASGGSAAYTNLLTGQSTTPVAGKQFGSVDGVLGGVVQSNTSLGYNSIPIPVETNPPLRTYAAIVRVISSQGTGTVFSDPNGFRLAVLNVTGVGNTTCASGLPNLVVGNAYLITCSFRQNFQNFRQTNLMTGYSVGNSPNLGRYVVTTTSPAYIGGGTAGSQQSGCYIAAAMISNAFLSPQEHLAWSRDPWGFWYPYRNNPVSYFTGIAKSLDPIGDIAVTEAPDVLTATGGIYGTGSLAVTEATDVTAATGSVAWLADLAVTDTNDTLAATGGIYGTGSLAVTETTDTFASTGSVAWLSDLAVTDVNDTFASTGSVAWTSDLAITEPADVFSASGKVETLWYIATTEAADVMSATASVVWIADLATIEPADTFASTGFIAWLTDIAITEPTDIFSALGTVSWGNPAWIKTSDQLVWRVSVNDISPYKVRIGDSI